jgi:nitrate reductase delta subunit
MKLEKEVILKLLSACLAYPDPTFIEALPELESTAAAVENAPARERLTDFLSRLKVQSLLTLQAHYTAAFDLNPSASLNLTYHLMGNREDRGRALSELIEVYRQAGFEPAVNDLPDFLPLLLEFLAAAPQAETQALIQRCLGAVPLIAARLREKGSMYVAPVEVVCGLFPETTCDARTQELEGA